MQKSFFHKYLLEFRNLWFCLFFLVQASISYYAAFLLRFDFLLSKTYLNQARSYFLLMILLRLLFYILEGLHKGLWRYASFYDFIKICRSVFLSSLSFFIIVRIFGGDSAFPRSVYFLDPSILIVLSAGSRMGMRIFREIMRSTPDNMTKILVIGAGDAAEMILRDMQKNLKSIYAPVAILDDDPYKQGKTLRGIKIVGGRGALHESIEKYKPEEIWICMPSVKPKIIREIYDLCKQTPLPIKILPPLEEIFQGKVSIKQIKPIALENLLQRPPIQDSLKNVMKDIQGKIILVTGAGGSIGSELCRQIIKYRPQKLIMLDRYENSLFDTQMELESQPYSDTILLPILADIQLHQDLEKVFSQEHPDVVFHAAAYKHVPILENHPVQAVRNNILGTKNLLEISSKNNVTNFIFISTDKAVNPTNIMGATKRIAEFLTLHANIPSRFKTTVVRFGNVLGSNGSVVPLFYKKIQERKPITITHPDVTRFFMLIPEAVQLLLMAASEGKGGEIFVLDMGEPIRILDLAINMIRLSGLVPYEDIPIVFTTLRPGEKMYEELFDSSEHIVVIPDKHFKKAIPKMPEKEYLEQQIVLLRSAMQKNSSEKILEVLKKIVPNFQKL